VGDQRRSDGSEAPIRGSDLEPYVALRYIARLFKVLAVLMVIMLVAEIATGLMMAGRDAVPTLLSAATRLLVLAGLMWGGGDLALLLVDLGHDVRVSRILLGRINSELHRQAPPGMERPASPAIGGSPITPGITGAPPDRRGPR
jgi:hypothetical protein